MRLVNFFLVLTFKIVQGLNCLGHRRLLVWHYLFRELDFEHDEEVAEFERVLVEWHAFFLDRQHLVRLDDHARLCLDSELGAVQEVDDEVHTAQRIHETDLLLHEQVSASSLEGIMWLLLNDEDNIACLSIRMLIRLTVEDELLTVRRPLVDIQLKYFLLLFEFRLLILIFLCSILLFEALASNLDTRRLAVVEVLQGARDWMDD